MTGKSKKNIVLPPTYKPLLFTAIALTITKGNWLTVEKPNPSSHRASSSSGKVSSISLGLAVRINFV
jgi:hypothetical protein